MVHLLSENEEATSYCMWVRGNSPRVHVPAGTAGGLLRKRKRDHRRYRTAGCALSQTAWPSVIFQNSDKSGPEFPGRNLSEHLCSLPHFSDVNKSETKWPAHGQTAEDTRAGTWARPGAPRPACFLYVLSHLVQQDTAWPARLPDAGNSENLVFTQLASKHSQK